MPSRRSWARTPALLLILPLLSCSPGQPAPVATAQPHTEERTPAPAPPPPADPAVEGQVLVAVSKALRKDGLLTRPDRCFAYRFDPAPAETAYTVDVSENHAHPGCGGDPATQPHLFTVHVDKQTRALSADTHTPGTFQPLNP